MAGVHFEIPNVNQLLIASKAMEDAVKSPSGLAKHIMWDAAVILEKAVQASATSYNAVFSGKVGLWPMRGKGEDGAKQYAWGVGYHTNRYGREIAYPHLMNIADKMGLDKSGNSAGIGARALAQAKGACEAKMQDTLDAWCEKLNSAMGLS